MKDYNEMASSVFRRRDEYLTARKKRNALLLKVVGSACALLLVAVVGISLWKNLPDIPSVKPTDPTPSATDIISTNNSQYSEDTTNAQTSSAAVNTNPESTKVPVLLPDPTETLTSVPSQRPVDTPQTGATDPTEVVDSTNGNDMAPDSSWEPPTDAPTEAVPTYPPTEGDDPTEPPWVEESTEAPTAEPWEPQPPTAAPTEAPTQAPSTVEPSEPTPQGELNIECAGKTYTAEVGDVVTLTVEFQADKPMKTLAAWAKYDNYDGYLQLIKDNSLTVSQLDAVHMPEIDPKNSSINYSYNKAFQYKAVRVVAIADDESFDFTKKKVFFTFSFKVVKPGKTSIELMIDTIIGADNTVYYNGGNKITADNMSFDVYLTKE